MPKDTVFSSQEPGEEVRYVTLHDAFGKEITKFALPESICVGYGDILNVRVEYYRDKEAVVELGVICPQCNVNPLYNSYGDYVCQECRRIERLNHAD